MRKKGKEKKTTKQRNKSRKSNSKLLKKISDILPHKAETPQTVNQLMKMFFKDYDPNTHIFRISDNVYSICIEYTDISFAKATKEVAINIFLKYVDYLNSFTNDVHIQVVNTSIPIKTEKLKQDFLFDENKIKEENPRILENKKKIAREFNKLISMTLGEKQETLESKRYIVLSTEANSYSEANKKLFRLYMKTEEHFAELMSRTRIVTCFERLKILYNLFNVQMLDESINDVDEYLKDKDINVFDFLSPNEVDLKNSDYISIDGGKKFISTIYLRQLPTSNKPVFYNKITTMENIEMITSLNITPTNNAKVIKKINRSITGMKSERITKKRSAHKHGLDYDDVKDEKLEDRLKETRQLLYDIQKNNQKIFKNNMIILVVANSQEELEKNIKRIMEVASESLIEFSKIKWQQIEGIQNALPLGFNTIQFQRSLTSEATASNVPFNAKDIMQKNGIYYGINTVTKNAIFADRKTLINGNGAILATSGAGKSFSAKTDIEQILLKTNDDVITIDLQREYLGLIDFYGGQTIEISTTASTYINPFDVNLNYGFADGKAEPIKEKTEYIIAFVESIVGSMTGGMKTIIDRCTRNIYEDYENSGFSDMTLLPNLNTFYDEMKKQPEAEAKQLCLILERYVYGSVDIYAHETNVNINNRFINFDLSNLSASMQNTGYLVVLDYIMNRLSANKKEGKYTWIMIDEFHILLANPFSAEYISKIYKTGRKFNAIPTVITQNITEVIENEYGVKILGNSEFAKILKQKPLDLSIITNIFNISPKEAKSLVSPKTGQGVIVFGQDKFPFQNQVPKEYLIYEINRTSET